MVVFLVWLSVRQWICPKSRSRGVNVRNADVEYMKYMLKYDTVFGRFPKELGVYEEGLVIDGRKIPVYSESDAANIPWSKCGAEYIVEGTGAYNTTEKAMVQTINQGAKKVIITAPAKDKTTPTFVMGVNHDEYSKDMDIVSNASCTTNCLAPVCKVIEDNWGIEQGLMSTIHAATAKQKVVDARSLKDWRTGRSACRKHHPDQHRRGESSRSCYPVSRGKDDGYRLPCAYQ